MFRMSVGLMQAVAKTNIDFVLLLDELAVFFQIIDDYLNLDDRNVKNKTFGDDFTEGKFSFVIIHHLKQCQYDTRVSSKKSGVFT
jgi:geranylgeranyl diphosphate synthase type 3